MTDLDVRKFFVAHARWYKGKSGGRRADFTDTDMSRKDFSSVNFHKAIFVRTNLAGATMSCSNFYECDFTGASLERAYLSSADLHESDFTNAVLDGANLANADMSRTILTGASFVNAYLPTCKLDGAVLNWESHDLVAEVLRRAARSDISRSIAGLFLVSREMSIVDIFDFVVPGMNWALNECMRWLREGDNAPAILREMRDD